MNFKMKALVAAVALTASMSASAAMTNNASGDSSLILTLLDNTNNISATFDLGYSYSTFLPGAVAVPGFSESWDLASNADYAAAWTSFLGTADLAKSHWAVFAGDAAGTDTLAGSRGMIVTYAGGAVSSTNLLTTSQLKDQLAGMGSYIDANIVANDGTNANDNGNHNTAANGASWSISGASFAESPNAYGTTGKVKGAGLVTWGGFDQELSVVQLKQGSGLTGKETFAAYAVNGNPTQFKLTSNGLLTVSAVPEADTWAMLLAGLGLMGFIARRRTAA